MSRNIDEVKLQGSRKLSKRARCALGGLRSAKSESELYEAWDEFTASWRDAFVVARTAISVGSFKRYADKMAHEVRIDPVLNYLRQTRNNRYYTCRTTASLRGPGIALGTPRMPNMFVVEGNFHLEASDNVVVYLDEQGRQVECEMLPDVTVAPRKKGGPIVRTSAPSHRVYGIYLELLPIENRGTHFPAPIASINPDENAIAVAQCGLNWLDNWLDRISQF